MIFLSLGDKGRVVIEFRCFFLRAIHIRLGKIGHLSGGCWTAVYSSLSDAQVEFVGRDDRTKTKFQGLTMSDYYFPSDDLLLLLLLSTSAVGWLGGVSPIRGVRKSLVE